MTAMSPESAAALFWYLRNRLYFELGLDRRADVLLVSYGAMVADPAAEMGRICEFLDLPYRAELHAHVDARAAAEPPAARDRSAGAAAVRRAGGAAGIGARRLTRAPRSPNGRGSYRRTGEARTLRGNGHHR